MPEPRVLVEQVAVALLALGLHPHQILERLELRTLVAVAVLEMKLHLPLPKQTAALAVPVS